MNATSSTSKTNRYNPEARASELFHPAVNSLARRVCFRCESNFTYAKSPDAMVAGKPANATGLNIVRRLESLRAAAEAQWQRRQFVLHRLRINRHDLASDAAIKIDDQRSTQIQCQRFFIATDHAQHICLLDG